MMFSLHQGDPGDNNFFLLARDNKKNGYPGDRHAFGKTKN
jgi:hypothetical protein